MNLIIKNGKVVEIKPDTDMIKDCVFEDCYDVEILFMLGGLDEGVE